MMAGCLHVSPSEPTGTVYQLASFKHCNCSFNLRSLTPLAVNGLSGNKPEYLYNLAKVQLKMALIASLVQFSHVWAVDGTSSTGMTPEGGFKGICLPNYS